MFHNSVFDETNSSVIQSNLHDQSGAVDFLQLFWAARLADQDVFRVGKKRR